MIKALAPTKHAHFTRSDAVGWFATHYPLIKPGTITAHLVRFSTNAPSRRHYNAKLDEDLLYQTESGHFRLYDAADDPTPIHTTVDLKNQANELAEDDDGEPPITSNEFAYEKDLQSFLVKNLQIFEPGLKLYQEDGINGIEYPAGGRFIDILAVDAQNRLVVIELKVSKGYDRVIGQTLRYMAWISKNLAEEGQAVRGIIAARDISEDLRLACSYLPNVLLYEYQLSVTMNKVLIDPLVT